MALAGNSEAVPERELRLALVCYGGVSLAVYMHGITREILKLVRASRAWHTLLDRDGVDADAASYADAGRHHGELDTEAIYFRLLQQAGRQIRLRVVVDVIAGASAGGINGVMLARALAFDLSLDAHRKLWLELADVGELLHPQARAGRLSKLYMRPVFWWLRLRQQRRAKRLGALTEGPEVLENLSLLMRSRWFEPPFSGPRMSALMLDALESMTPGVEEGSLLPPGLPLELYVTATDFWGHRQTIPLHDPPEVQEEEHRHIFRFRHWRGQSGPAESELDASHLPSLAFAARATSSFPGAFPPLRLAEMDAVVGERRCGWRGRAAFLASQFKGLQSAGEDPEDAAFIDGSVLMNKPVSLALDAVQRHVAHRETDRRLVYLEPNPEVARAVAHEVPGFFKTIKGALSDIPRHQPIRDDLESIAGQNASARLHRQVVNAVKPKVLEMMAAILADQLETPPDAMMLGQWRMAANELAAIDAGYTFEGYARLKVLVLLEQLAGFIRRAAPGLGEIEASARIRVWAEAEGILPLLEDGGQVGVGEGAEDVPWILFLRRFDLGHRLRRVSLLIRRINELYTEQSVHAAGNRSRLDQLKARLYDYAEQLRGCLDWMALEPAEKPLTAGESGVESLMLDLRFRLDLADFDLALDRVLAAWTEEGAEEGAVPELVREIFTTYLGFAYYDVLTYPMVHAREFDSLDEIKVDRIAVDDANTLRAGDARQILKGVEFGSFGAFFSRRFRENDYLWGRLTAAERLVDIVGSSVPEAVSAGLDLHGFKKALFLAILDAETSHLEEIGEDIATLRAEAERL